MKKLRERGQEQIDGRASDAGQRDGDPGRSEAEVWAFVDKIINAMNATVKSGLAVSEDGVLPGPIKLHSKANGLQTAMTQEFQSDRGIAAISAYALAGSEERAGPPGHHRADRQVLKRHAGTRLRPGRRRSQAVAGQDSPRHARGGGCWLPLQAQCNAVGGRRRLPGGNRRRVGDGRGHAGNGLRRDSRVVENARSPRWNITWA
jgi:hypothetical protein